MKQFKHGWFLITVSQITKTRYVVSYRNRILGGASKRVAGAFNSIESAKTAAILAIRKF